MMKAWKHENDTKNTVHVLKSTALIRNKDASNYFPQCFISTPQITGTYEEEEMSITF